MKIKQVNQPSNRKLYEQIDAENSTPFKTEDLVKIAQADRDNCWEDVTWDELFEGLPTPSNARG